MRVYVGAIRQPFLEYHVRKAVQQHEIRAGRDRQMYVRHLCIHGDARIDHDHRKFALLQRHLEAPVYDRMLFRQIGAERHQAFGVLEIVVTTGRSVGTERTLVPGYRRGHA